MKTVAFSVHWLALTLSSPAVQAFDVNDCIINGMKGVSSDMAARQVRYACDQKRLEARKLRVAALTKEYGDALEIESIEQAPNFGAEQAGMHFIQVRNKNPDKAVKLLRLEVAPAIVGGAACDMTKSRRYSYSVTMKAFEALNLVYPSTAQTECLSIVAAYGRASSWRDVSFSFSAKPDDSDPFADIE